MRIAYVMGGKGMSYYFVGDKFFRTVVSNYIKIRGKAVVNYG